MIVKLLTEHHLEFLSLTGGCRGPSESTLAKMSNCWKSHALAHFILHQHAFILCKIVDVKHRTNDKRFNNVSYSFNTLAWSVLQVLGLYHINYRRDYIFSI